MEKQEKLRQILIDSGATEYGDAIIDEICQLFGYADTNEFVLSEPQTEDEARQQAIDWQDWASGEHLQLSYGELANYADHFTETGKKFNLTDEFKENGIL
jgi:hypothetical protein